MKDYKITAVIPFCSLDEPFFVPCIENLLKLGIECIVMSYDHLYGGEKEDIEILYACKDAFADNPLFKMKILKYRPGRSSLFYEAFARHLGAVYASKSNEHILFIDIDEIVDTEKMSIWLEKGIYKKYRGIKLNCYLYDREPIYQVKEPHYNTVLCKKWYAQDLDFKEKARLYYFNNNNKISRWTAKLRINPLFYIYHGEPFIHHYTGVRKNMDKKLKNWSHNIDYDIVKIIQDGRKITTNDPKFLKKVNIVNNQFNISI